MRGGSAPLAVASHDTPYLASHSRAAVCQHRVENRSQLAGRTADDLQHVSGGGLLLQGFTQLVEQPRVLDGDDGLSSEVLRPARSACR